MNLRLAIIFCVVVFAARTHAAKEWSEANDEEKFKIFRDTAYFELTVSGHSAKFDISNTSWNKLKTATLKFKRNCNNAFESRISLRSTKNQKAEAAYRVLEEQLGNFIEGLQKSINDKDAEILLDHISKTGDILQFFGVYNGINITSRGLTEDVDKIRKQYGSITDDGVKTMIALNKYGENLIQGGQFHSNIRIDGKVVIITGSNAGIGRECALDLAGRGAHIHMACRDYKRCEIARREIIAKTGNQNVYNRELDLASMDSIRNFVTKFLLEEKRLDILINNAGVMAMRQALTKDGFEMQLGVNHLGHFLLTNLLLDILKSSAPSRIIVLSSVAHKYGKINRKDLNSEKSYNRYKAYAQSKLANFLFVKELARRLKNTHVTVNAVHPGIVKTDLWQYVDKRYLKKLTGPIMSSFFKTAKSGAQTSIRLAVDPELENVSGEYFADCKIQRVARSARKNNDDAEWLWKQSEKMTRLSPQKIQV